MLFFQKDIVFLFTLIYYFTNKSLLTKREKSILYFLFVFYIFFDLLMGNKSAIYKFGIFFIIALFAVENSIKLKFKSILYSALMIIIGIYFYFLGNLIRDQIWKDGGSLTTVLNVMSEIDTDYFKTYGDFAASHLGGRIGYLDYSARMIKFSKTYEPLINFPHYIKSFIDDILPGTYFNAVKGSTGIAYIDKYSIIPTQTEYLKSGYFSECITIYGEFFTLGRGLSLGCIQLVLVIFVIFYVFSFFFKKVKSEFQYNILKGLLIFIFYSLLDSFGIDWLFSTLFFVLLFYYLFNKYYCR